MNGNNPAGRQLETAFGPLEVRVLDTLWQLKAPSCVRDVLPQFPGVAYTTLMTTLDRLYRKGTLSRQKSGRAFYYQPKLSQPQLLSQLAGSTLATLLPGDAASMRPILSMFVETVSERDRGLLDELEQLVRARRGELKDRTAK